MSIKINSELPFSVAKRLGRTIEDLKKEVEITPFELVNKIYKAADFYYKKGLEKRAVCKRGCSWCCYIPVDVSAIEVQYIFEKTGIDANELRGVQPRQKIDNSPCPFLKNNECSIYESRPFHCRVFATLDDPKFCIGGNQNHIISTVESNSGLMIMHNLLLEASNEYNISQFADIRQWFDKSVSLQKKTMLK